MDFDKKKKKKKPGEKILDHKIARDYTNPLTPYRNHFYNYCSMMFFKY